MLRKKKKNNIEDAQVVEEVIEQKVEDTPKEEPKPDFRTFEFADLKLVCGRCGEVATLDEGVESGIQIILPTTDKHEMKMVCGKCGNFMRLYFTENLTKKKTTNEPETANKKEESVQGVSKDN